MKPSVSTVLLDLVVRAASQLGREEASAARGTGSFCVALRCVRIPGRERRRRGAAGGTGEAQASAPSATSRVRSRGSTLGDVASDPAGLPVLAGGIVSCADAAPGATGSSGPRSWARERGASGIIAANPTEGEASVGRSREGAGCESGRARIRLGGRRRDPLPPGRWGGRAARQPGRARVHLREEPEGLAELRGGGRRAPARRRSGGGGLQISRESSSTWPSCCTASRTSRSTRRFPPPRRRTAAGAWPTSSTRGRPLSWSWSTRARDEAGEPLFTTRVEPLHPRRGRLRRPLGPEGRQHAARAGSRRRRRVGDPAAAGAAVPAERRQEPASRRSRLRQGRGLRPTHHPWPVLVRDRLQGDRGPCPRRRSDTGGALPGALRGHRLPGRDLSHLLLGGSETRSFYGWTRSSAARPSSRTPRSRCAPSPARRGPSSWR